MIVAGVDYSMSCPALVIGELGSDFSDLKFYSFAKQKRHISIKKEIILLEYPEYINEQDRYDKKKTPKSTFWCRFWCNSYNLLFPALFAEREGFEPPEPRSSTVFKTAAIDHSATSPFVWGCKDMQKM